MQIKGKNTAAQQHAAKFNADVQQLEGQVAKQWGNKDSGVMSCNSRKEQKANVTDLRRPPTCAACPTAAFSLRLLIAVVSACNKMTGFSKYSCQANSRYSAFATLLSV